MESVQTMETVVTISCVPTKSAVRSHRVSRKGGGAVMATSAVKDLSATMTMECVRRHAASQGRCAKVTRSAVVNTRVVVVPADLSLAFLVADVFGRGVAFASSCVEKGAPYRPRVSFGTSKPGIPSGRAYCTISNASVAVHAIRCRGSEIPGAPPRYPATVSYTHLRAHETSLHLVCRLLLEKSRPATLCV